MRIQIPFIGDSAQSRTLAANDQLTVNLYPEIEQAKARNVIGLYSVPGLKNYAVGGIGPCRSQGVVFGGAIYFVSGSSLLKIDTNAVVTTIGSLVTTSGRVSMVAGRTYLMLVDGTKGYTYNGATFAQIADLDFPTADYVAWLDGYFIVNKNGSDSWYISAVDDPTSWGALDFAVAEAKPDIAIRPETLNGYVYLLGDVTTQAYFESGNALFPFDAILPNGVFEWGMMANDSLAKADNAMLWLAKNERGDAVVVQCSGLDIQVISNQNISYQINALTTITDAQGFAYRHRGHLFYVLTFPAGGKTFVYDLTSGMWHERRTYGLGRWRPSGYGYLNGKHIVGDYLSNKFYELDFDTFLDDDQPIERIRRGPVFSDKNNRVFFNRFEILFEAGTGLITGQGSDPQAMLRYSDDGGYTWGNERWTSMGAIGERRWRAIWNQLGASYGRVFEVTVSDPVNVTIIDAYADIEVEAE